jgi:Flp pilus assembly CpaF family ATPase
MQSPTDAIHRPLTSTEMVTHSLRLRPGQIIVGEAHDPETATLLDALSVHPQGRQTTFHIDLPKQL